MREPFDHLSRLAILNLYRRVPCVPSKLVGVRIDVSPGQTIQGRSLRRYRLLSIQRGDKAPVRKKKKRALVANLILLNVIQLNPKPRTMPICSLAHCYVSPVFVIHLVHHVVHSRYSGDGSLRSKSLGSGSLGGRSRYIDPHQFCVHTTRNDTPREDRDHSFESLIGSLSPLGPRMFDDLGDPLLLFAPIFTYLSLSLAIQYSGWFPPLG